MKRHIFCIVCSIVAILSLTACGSKKDVKVSPITKDQLIGKWNFNDTHDAIFNEDGTCSIYEFQTKGEFTDATYELTNDTTIQLLINGYWKGTRNEDNSLTLNINGIEAVFEKTDAELSIIGTWTQKGNEAASIKTYDDGKIEFINNGAVGQTSGVSYTYTYDDVEKTFLVNSTIIMNIGLNGDKLRFNNVDFTKVTEEK